MASIVTVALATVTFQSVRGLDMVCEDLPPDVCAFAVSTGRKRFVLELAPRCQTSVVRVRALSAAWVETDACVRACGVDRAALGLTVVVSDSAAAAEDRRHLRALCSPACQDGCPNIVDLALRHPRRQRRLVAPGVV